LLGRGKREERTLDPTIGKKEKRKSIDWPLAYSIERKKEGKRRRIPSTFRKEKKGEERKHFLPISPGREKGKEHFSDSVSQEIRRERNPWLFSLRLFTRKEKGVPKRRERPSEKEKRRCKWCHMNGYKGKKGKFNLRKFWGELLKGGRGDGPNRRFSRKKGRLFL